jgi:hypothetical protein
VTLEPPTALLTVDGRPLAAAQGSERYHASTTRSGTSKPLGKRRFQLELDPGPHVFRAVRAGHQDVVLPKSYHAGARSKLDLRLDVLPATVSVKSSPAQAIVRVDDREVGLTPIEFQRPAGHYALELDLDDYETHSAALDLRAGERADLTAELVPYETPLYEQWWFWTGAIAVVAGGVVLTYFLTRPEPETPPYDGGTTGWVVTPQAFEF